MTKDDWVSFFWRECVFHSQKTRCSTLVIVSNEVIQKNWTLDVLLSDWINLNEWEYICQRGRIWERLSVRLAVKMIYREMNPTANSLLVNVSISEKGAPILLYQDQLIKQLALSISHTPRYGAVQIRSI
ncbi:hypothetical protein [Geobacillus sp. TFV-3]|uniref:hypothetical protein n=1 Tax=Geobacillus sp. TFV-3 TaxID=1897059 RepID=UPI0013598DE8|nr:hypothetical protein [Geobacillus sp. TFV-3]